MATNHLVTGTDKWYTDYPDTKNCKLLTIAGKYPH